MDQSANRIENRRKKYLTRRKKRHDLEEKRKLELQNNPECRKKELINKSKLNNNKSSSSNIENAIVIDDNSNDMNDDDDDDTENDSETDICNEKYLYIAKLLQFSENTRPAYYGTWRKKSKCITGRKPFQLDKVSIFIGEGELLHSFIEKERGFTSSENKGDLFLGVNNLIFFGTRF